MPVEVSKVSLGPSSARRKSPEFNIFKTLAVACLTVYRGFFFLCLFVCFLFLQPNFLPGARGGIVMFEILTLTK